MIKNLNITQYYLRIIKLTAIIFLPLAFLLSCKNEETEKLLVGKWEFMKFYVDGEITNELQADLDNFNSLNRGLTIRFSPSGEYESDQPGGSKENNSIRDYKVIPGNKLIIEKDTMEIIKVDQEFLQLHRDNSSPNIMFRRINNTGTEPGRR